MPNIHLKIEPRGKGRPRFRMINGHPQAYTDSETKAYEETIRNEWIKAGHGIIEGTISVSVAVGIAIPKSATKAERQRMQEQVFAPKKPDIDNVVKAVLDALNGVAFTDDRFVVSLIASKYYTQTGEPSLMIGVDRWIANNEHK